MRLGSRTVCRPEGLGFALRASKTLHAMRSPWPDACTGVVKNVSPCTGLIEESVSVDQTQQVIDRYFDVMSANGDFSRFYHDGVTWTMVDAGAEIRGAAAVRDYIIALHAQMIDVHTRRFVSET